MTFSGSHFWRVVRAEARGQLRRWLVGSIPASAAGQRHEDAAEGHLHIQEMLCQQLERKELRKQDRGAQHRAPEGVGCREGIR